MNYLLIAFLAVALFSFVIGFVVGFVGGCKGEVLRRNAP